MADFPEKLDRLLGNLEILQDRSQRIELLIGMAERFEEVPETIARRPFAEDHLVPACESQAYVWSRGQVDGTLKFHFAVENPQGVSARALAVILDETLSGAPPEQVVRVPRDIVYKIFGNELSMGKSMGLMGMVSMVQTAARKRLERATAAPAGK
jgi:cysteine desulfuration protein SufE